MSDARLADSRRIIWLSMLTADWSWAARDLKVGAIQFAWLQEPCFCAHAHGRLKTADWRLLTEYWSWAARDLKVGAIQFTWLEKPCFCAHANGRFKTEDWSPATRTGRDLRCARTAYWRLLTRYSLFTLHSSLFTFHSTSSLYPTPFSVLINRSPTFSLNLEIWTSIVRLTIGTE